MDEKQIRALGYDEHTVKWVIAKINSIVKTSLVLSFEFSDQLVQIRGQIKQRGRFILKV